MLEFISRFNFVIFAIFTLCYSYQFIYAFIALLQKPKKLKAKRTRKYAVIISARNESAVIGQLIQSIKKQKYPTEMIDTYVVADNCTDNTADIAREAGAIVHERFNQTEVGKSYALDYLLKIILNSPKAEDYDGYFVFDADNLLDENYIFEMNNVFDSDYKVVTSYRNSKNYDSNWISAGYSLWFLRESKYLNNSRMMLNASAAISGTGFLIHKDIIKKNNGWKHHLLTEDIEFTVDNVIQGEKIGYCGDAILYDEQPVTFKQSWNQRLRWAKGFYQVFANYGTGLVKGIFKKKSFACFDMFMTISPAVFITIISVLMNCFFLIFGILTSSSSTIIAGTLSSLLNIFEDFYLIFLFFGGMTLFTEWKKIRAKNWKKIMYLFSFPIFMLTYIPIAVVALFKRIEWIPIKHSVTKTIEDIQ